jgi:dTDP-4-amino-4,6-dideoxygalactose transaminase
MTTAFESPIFTANPRAGYFALRQEIDAAIADVLAQPHHILGPVVERFEETFARFVGVAHGVGVNSGTDALHLALRGLGVGPGDDVVTASHTSVATVAAIEMSGATPVLVDVEPRWRTIDPAAVEQALGPRTKAVIAVHLYGLSANLDGLQSLCARHGLLLIEDCAQAHGARWRGKIVGAFGVAACFSFYPTKNLGAVGDGGMVVTADPILAERVRSLRQYGWDRPQHSIVPGWNSRLGPLQAAILQAKLPHLERVIERRRRIATHYGEALCDVPLELPEERSGSRHAWHLYVVRVKVPALRAPLMTHLLERGVVAGIHYPEPVHTQPAYAGRIRASIMDQTEALASSVLSLPLYPELDEAGQSRVVDAVKDFFVRPRQGL